MAINAKDALSEGGGILRSSSDQPTEVREKEPVQRSLISLSFEKWQVVGRVDSWIIAITIVAVLLWHFFRKKLSTSLTRDIESVTIKFGALPEAVIRINRDTQKIAFSAYTELITRKIALPFDEDHDVIKEIYKSWYHVFSVTRELIKQIPAHHLTSSEDTRALVEILINLLNVGLRPHLTKWNAKFSRWYDIEESKDGNKGVDPQDIQKKYPRYDELISEIKSVNHDFILLAKQLRMLAEARKIP